MKPIALIAVAAVVFATGFAGPAGAAGQYKVVKKFKLGGDGRWDYVTIDGVSRKAYITRTDRVMVVDADKGTLLGEIGDMTGVHGVALAPAANRGFATSGKDDTVRIFDLKTLKQVAQVKAGKKPDAIIFDPASNKVFAFNNGGTTATAIDPVEGKVVGEIELGGSPEAAVSDRQGRVFVNLEDKSQIAVIDSKKLKVVAHWSLAPGEEPSGLAIDVVHNRLFSGCRNKLMMVVDSNSGKVVAQVAIGQGVDGCGFDVQSQNAFSSNGKDGTLTVVHEEDPKTFTVVDNVETQPGARTMCIDSRKHQVWTITAEFEKSTDAKESQDRRHQAIVPGSFTALVIGK